MQAILPVTVAIPTYRREQVLLETLDYLLALDSPPAEILVLDQTERHAPAIGQRLMELHAAGRIRWLQLDTPSIPQAMNRGLLEARQDIVLFVDDDIRPEPGLIAAHAAAHRRMRRCWWRGGSSSLGMKVWILHPDSILNLQA